MNATERLVTRAIAEQARAWLIANREPSLSTEHQGKFLAWLRASPVHVREYLAVAKAAAELRAAAEAVDTPTQDLIALARSEPDDNVASMVPLDTGGDEFATTVRPRRPARNLGASRLMALAASFCALVAVLAWWSILQSPTNKEYRTQHGEQRVVRFEDGSVVHINSDSVVRVDYTERERHVSMARGQAMFKVAREEARPFRVSVGGTDVVAVGTEFDVRRLNEDVLVTVVEGAVAVSSAGKFDSASGVEPPMPLQLAAGQQARVAQAHVTEGPRPATRQPVDVRSVDIRPAVAWVEQKIMFERQTLQSVASEFNRYGPKQLVIEDSKAAALEISGIFNAYDLESFVLYLETINGLQVHHEPNLIRISLARNIDGEMM